jgi:hypothetical protein
MKITKETLKQLVMEELKATLDEGLYDRMRGRVQKAVKDAKPGQTGRDNPVLYKANQIEYYVKLLQQAARSGNADHRASSIQAIKDLLTQIEGV